MEHQPLWGVEHPSSEEQLRPDRLQTDSPALSISFHQDEVEAQLGQHILNVIDAAEQGSPALLVRIGQLKEIYEMRRYLKGENDVYTT